ncbi:O-antigen ligase family protein [Cellulomonas wangsupingiae]|uniref:O-antigen ligase family protein n=1 Tax=Cellulomonas wangsupingiae TaxID=2968085 RepID=A0ABY5K3F0_9CELL|nr:O-antigen ligase family protein [Cellulomonas wangsupingiae]MCC2335706.1 O-antigen ligase family protein [Cellulomonas wangsupingiae]UUI63941.1 O-antigen ligase family protein [Cellulomonas wangsupingiae]
MNARPRGDAATVALVLLVGAPLVVVPGATSVHVLGKLAVVAVGLLVAAHVPASGRLPRPVVAVLAVGAVVLVAAAALSDVGTAAALAGRWPRYEGMIALPLYAGAAWAGARLLGPGADAARWRVVHRTAAVVALGMAAVALVEAAGLRLPGADGLRIGSLQGNASELGVLGAVLLLTLLPVTVATRRPLPFAGVLAAAITLAASGSRAGLAALVAGGVLLLVTSRSGRRPALVTLAAAAGVTTLALLVPAARARLLTTSTVEGRAVLWADTLELLRGSPLLGVGPSGFVDAVGPVHGAQWLTRVGVQDPPDSPHSWPLQAAVAGGWGLAALAAVLAVLVVVLGTRRARSDAPGVPAWALGGALAAVVGYGTALLTHFTAPGTTPLVALLAGAAVAAAPARSRLTPAPVIACGGGGGDGHERPGHHIAAAGRGDGTSVPGPGRATAATDALWRAGAAALSVVLAAAVAGEAVLGTAYRRVGEGDLAGAVTAFGTAQRLRPWDADLTAHAAAAFATLASSGVPGAADVAVAWGTSASARLPASVPAATALSVGLRTSGRPHEALAVLDDALARQPHAPDTLVQRAVTRATLGDLDGAREDLDAAVAVAPDHVVAWEQLAGVLARLGDARAEAAAGRARDLQASVAD